MATSTIKAKNLTLSFQKHYSSLQELIDNTIVEYSNNNANALFASVTATVATTLCGKNNASMILIRKASDNSSILNYVLFAGNNNGVFQGIIDAANNNAVTYVKVGS